MKRDKDGGESIVNIPYRLKLLIVTDLYQLHYQIMLIIFQMDYIIINVQIVNLVLII